MMWVCTSRTFLCSKFPLGVRSPRNMVNNYYCHIFLFVTTEIKVFPNRLFDFCLNGETMVIDFSEDITWVCFWASLTTFTDAMQLTGQENCLSIIFRYDYGANKTVHYSVVFLQRQLTSKEVSKPPLGNGLSIFCHYNAI